MEESFPIQQEKRVPKLEFAHLAPEVWEALAELPRAGWVKRGVENPESVQDHIVALRDLATSLEDLSEAEKDGLLDMLEVHDWPEAIHGDEIIVTHDIHERKKLKELKFENEKKAMTQICGGLGNLGKRIMDLWLRFESSNDEAAIFARQLDTYQAVEKSLEYEKAQNIPMFEDFYAYALPNITHPVLVERMSALKSEWVGLQEK